MKDLADWSNFYVIVGSAAGALIGLQFVVLTLIANAPGRRTDIVAGNAFATPSVIHFCVVLLLSAIISAPWQGFGIVATLLGLVGFGGVLYSFVVVRRLRAQTVYRPVMEDWIFHAVLPIVAYMMIVASAFLADANPRPALFIISTVALVLLFIGIHNGWDAITYHIFVARRERGHDEGDSSGSLKSINHREVS